MFRFILFCLVLFTFFTLLNVNKKRSEKIVYPTETTYHPTVSPVKSIVELIKKDLTTETFLYTFLIPVIFSLVFLWSIFTRAQRINRGFLKIIFFLTPSRFKEEIFGDIFEYEQYLVESGYSKKNISWRLLANTVSIVIFLIYSKVRNFASSVITKD